MGKQPSIVPKLRPDEVPVKTEGPNGIVRYNISPEQLQVLLDAAGPRAAREVMHDTPDVAYLRIQKFLQCRGLFNDGKPVVRDTLDIPAATPSSRVSADNDGTFILKDMLYAKLTQLFDAGFVDAKQLDTLVAQISDASKTDRVHVHHGKALLRQMEKLAGDTGKKGKKQKGRGPRVRDEELLEIE